MNIFAIILVAFATVDFTVGIISFGVPCNDKKTIVNLHNEMRKQIANGQVPNQPKSSNMQMMVWDDQLAKLAQNYANKMTFEHNQHRSDNRFKVGENLFIYYTTAPGKASNWKQAINDWFNEHKIYHFQPLVSDPATGHYTQIVWADTQYVGCGFTYYKKNGWFNKLYVCNYGPTGNWLGELPYKKGAGCENLCCKKQCGKLYGNQC